MDRTELRRAIAESGLRSASNTVRPPRTRVSKLGDVTCRITDPESPLQGAIIRNTLTAGYASDGFKSNYEKRRRWWIVTSLESDDGWICWARGTRFTDQDKVQAEWAETIATMRELDDVAVAS